MTDGTGPQRAASEYCVTASIFATNGATDRFLRLRDENWREREMHFWRAVIAPRSDTTTQCANLSRGLVYAVQIVYRVKKWLCTRDS